MIDFLKAHPFVTMDDYLWKWTIPQIRLAMYDSTHIEYTKTKNDKKRKGGKTKKAQTPKNVMKLDSLEAVQEFMRQTGGKA